MISELSIKRLFPQRPIVYFRSTRSVCCERDLCVLKTYLRSVASLAVGEFRAHITLLVCPHCKNVYACEELRTLVPASGNFGFDVMVYVGQALFLRSRNSRDIQDELREQNVRISLREIDYLGKRFIVYLTLAHEHSQAQLKQFMGSLGGYVLHLDGTCEGDSPHLMSSIDELSKIVLGNIKIPSENAAQIIPFLSQIKHAYGNPIALVHDMGSAILNAIKAVFPGIPDFICHFHFLKDIGKDLFGQEYGTIRRHLKSHRIRSHLRNTARKLKKAIEQDTEASNCFHSYLKSEPLHQPQTSLVPVVTAYLIVSWVLEAKHDSHGFGFPFDRLHFDFYLRLQEAYPDLLQVKQSLRNDASLLPLVTISRTLADKALGNTVVRMQEKVRIFDQLREAMRIAQPDSLTGLNDQGDPDITTIKARVIAFRHSQQMTELAATTIAYRKMLTQLDKYWEKLFADPIQVSSPTGPITIQPQRTNNIMEQFFRDLKRKDRKRSGNHALSNTLKTMFAQTPLVKNLNNPEYMEILLKGKPTLAERFAEIDIVQVRKAFAEAQKVTQKYPKRMAEVFKIPHLPKQLVKASQKKSAIY